MENAPKSREGRSGKERILDAAEQLFAQRGFDGVSVRDITEAAQVDVALVSYHFGGKTELFSSLFQRRSEILNAERSLALEAVLESCRPGTPSIEAVIDTYVQPMRRLALSGEQGWKYYFQIVAQVNNSPHWAPLLMSRNFDPSAVKLIEVIRAALPHAPAAEIYWAIQFLAGSMTMTFAQTGRIDKLSGGLCSSADLKTALERLVPYTVAGFKALAGLGDPPAAKIAEKPARKAKLPAKRPSKAAKSANVAKKRP